MAKAANEKRVPKLRFPEFDGAWTFKQIQSLIDDGGIIGHLDGNHGELYPRADEFSSHGVPYIAATDLVDGRVNFEKTKRLPKERAEKFRKGIAKNGDVLFAHNATVGPVAILKINTEYVILSTTVTYFRCDPSRISNNFLLFSFSVDSFVRQYKRVMSQSTRNQVPISTQRKFSIRIPPLPEQKKIAAFLGAVDDRIAALRKKRDLLSDYKRGVMQQIFSQKIRFTRDDGTPYPDWEEKRLGEVLIEHKLRSSGKEEVFSVSVHKGLINQVEHLGRSFSAKDTKHYNLVQPNDVVYTKSPTGKFPYGIIKQSRVLTNVIVSPLYGVFAPETPFLGYILNDYFSSEVNVHNFLHPIIQKGAKNTINITNDTFLSAALFLPVDHGEQRKIADFLSVIDAKIDAVTQQIDRTETFKKGLLQQMFV
ncbi:restriction endonuclease subunit S [Hyphococcus formosus]|uniref:restriction endonuclease subunit S n=1 Tax=Hyphococcus formosus TaxID=3143534 RepID=UPI00398B2E94